MGSSVGDSGEPSFRIRTARKAGSGTLSAEPVYGIPDAGQLVRLLTHSSRDERNVLDSAVA